MVMPLCCRSTQRQGACKKTCMHLTHLQQCCIMFAHCVPSKKHNTHQYYRNCDTTINAAAAADAQLHCHCGCTASNDSMASLPAQSQWRLSLQKCSSTDWYVEHTFLRVKVLNTHTCVCNYGCLPVVHVCLQHSYGAIRDMQRAHILSAYPHEQNFGGVLLLCFKKECVQGSFAVLGSPPLT